MGFFSGLLMFQAVLVLLVVFGIFGFVAGIAVTVFWVKSECPEAYELVDQKTKADKEKKHDRSDDS